MNIAILSDIHANLEAFSAVIADFEERRPDHVICLGDLIGYGPNPDEVVRLFKQKGYISVKGNHEAVLSDRGLLRWFNFQAKDNSEATEKMLSLDNRVFCQNLPASFELNGAIFVHGFPPDSSFLYINRLSDDKICSFLAKAEHGLFFVGHTHNLQVYCWDGKRLTKQRVFEQKYVFKKGCKYIVNAGSVGQPRDGDNRAKYLIWDTGNRCLEIVRLEYDYKLTAKKIIDRGFPSEYAFRLG